MVRRGVRALVLALMACLCACSAGGSAAPDSALKIGIKFDQPGLGLRTGSTYTGLDVDVATYVARKLGTPPTDIAWVQAPSAQRETLLSTGQVDFVVATYSITADRSDKVSFAGPYFVAGQDLLVRAADTSISGPASLEGKKLCSVAGSTSAQTVSDHYPGVQLQEVTNASQCLPALRDGAVDAVTSDNAILAGYAAEPAYRGMFRLVGKPFSTEAYGIGLRKGDTTLCRKITAAITAMIDDGSWEKFVARNLGPSGFTPGPGNPPTPKPCT